MTWVFLLAYTCSGLAGLIYQVSWTRLLTMYIGHTTAAASAVVAAFLGGLAIGAAGGGVVASRLTPRRSLHVYAGLEMAVGLAALLLPLELTALTPLLEWAYRNGEPGLLFPAIRLLSCLLVVFVPATALGATFPLAIRWFAADSNSPARASGSLYAANTAGAAVGSLLAGFVLIPSIGLSATTRSGVAASILAAIAVLAVAHVERRGGQPAAAAAPPVRRPRAMKPRRKRRETAAPDEESGAVATSRRWLAAAVLGLSGFAALVHEIAWTRILALLLGPTIYAFSAALAAVIAGVAIGSGIGSWIAGRARQPAAWLAFALAGAAFTATWTSGLAGGQVPRLVAEQMASSPDLFDQLLRQGTILTATLILPTAICLGAAFPLALAIAGGTAAQSAGRFSSIYAVNTVGAVSGTLIAGFVFIPRLGLQTTLTVVSVCLIAAMLMVVTAARLSRNMRIASAAAAIVAVGVLAFSPPWDRELLASGGYLYAPFVPKTLDLVPLLKAGTLLYYRDGAAATVSVKRLTGTTTLAVDGKVDASNRSDMLTQKLVAHLPLLLHENPREVGIIGLGSGATLGSALRHPMVTRADVLEISPEVVEASSHFAAENYKALDDPRTHLIVGDGRSHLLLAHRQYDVLISEPSNPWIAGVAALFTREFFVAARERLAPGGIICQWANAYNISEADLRSIVATFTSVFPNGTAWLVGADDVLLVASDRPLDARLANIERNWTRPGVAEDLREVAVAEPFSVWTMFVGGPQELARYGAGAPILTDDRMSLEFSAPRQLHKRNAGDNGATLTALLQADDGPALMRDGRRDAGAAQWRNRAAMWAKSNVNAMAYDDYVHALQIDPRDAAALDGLTRVAVLTHRASDALSWVKSLTAGKSTIDAQIAVSKLLAANGSAADAVEAAREASRMLPVQPRAYEQLASLAADLGDTSQLDEAVTTLRRIAPDRPATHYFAAVATFLRGDAEATVKNADQAITLDSRYAPVYDLIGAAHTKLGQPAKARAAFLKSLEFDAHDSTAYTNLGLIDLAAGNRDAAARYFAEALWLDPESKTAREGLSRSK